MTRGIGGVGGQGEDGREESAQSVFPHYKFNLTNGSENLETMEYMKCGRVYHAARWRRGVVPTAILSGPIHILRVARRGVYYMRGYEGGRSAESAESGPRPARPVQARGEWQNTLLARGEEVARGEVDARFLSRSCRSHGCANLMYSTIYHR